MGAAQRKCMAEAAGSAVKGGQRAKAERSSNEPNKISLSKACFGYAIIGSMALVK
jgi:hypothetical protein